MATKTIIPAFVILISLVFGACDKDDQPLDVEQLPERSQQFISTHFSGLRIQSVTRDDDREYDVLLENNYRLEFNANGDIREVEGRDPLPNSIIPDAILDYVNQNFAGEAIVKWELDNREQEITLTNGTELVFDQNGNFVRIDR